MNNYKVLFGLRILKNILTTFVDSFFVLYFLDVSDSNILPLGIYKLIAVIAIYSVIFLARNFAKSKHRINLIRIGIMLDFVYFLTIILLKDRIVDYMYLVGLLYGLEEGFYYSVYNILESDGITNEERAKFNGSYTATQSVLSIIFPLIFGSLIYATGFIKSLIIVLVIVTIRIFLSFIFKDKNIPKSNKTDMRKYFEMTKNDKRFKQLYKLDFFNGITYSEGAFSYIVTIYILKVFSNSFSLGVFTSIFSIITCILGILFAKFIKKEHYETAIRITTTFTVIALCLMIYKCNILTIVLFNLFQTISKNIISLINITNRANLSNIEKIHREFKVEYYLSTETALIIGRIISYTLFILMAFTNSNIIMFVFVLLLIFYAQSSINLQRAIEGEKVQ